MKLTVKREIIEEVELPDFPIFKKNICYWVKIISEEKCIAVHIGYMGTEINIQKWDVSNWINYEPSTEDEFVEMYNLAWHEVNQEVFPIPEPSLNHQLSPGLQIAY